MKIALIGYEANIKNRVGSNQYAFELMKALYELDQKNQYTVFLPTPPLSDLPPSKSNWQYRVVGPRKFWNLFGLPLALWQQKPKPDVVFNPGHYCPLVFPAPLVVSIMDLGYLHYPEHFTKKIYWKLKFWTALSIKRATHLLTISQSTKNDIIKYYRVDSNKITVGYPGYDREKFKSPFGPSSGRGQNSKVKIEEVKKKYKIKGDYILSLSTLKPSKNIEGLLEAFKIVLSEETGDGSQERGEKNSKLRTQNSCLAGRQVELKLVIAGKKGWLFEKIFEKVKELGLKDKVIFTGFVEEKEVPALMAGAKVFVMPSFWEGFGIPVVEAMACGTPVVVSKTGSLPEIVGQAGVLIDPYNPEDIALGIKKAMEEKNKLTARGLEQSCQFNWLNCAKEVIEVLNDIGKSA